jgi:hypothetical protein
MKTASPPICRIHVDQAGNDLVLRRRTGSFADAAFLLLWLTIWTAACVLLVVRLGQEPTFEHVVFTIPFLVAWPVGFAILLTAFLGFERLRVGSDGLEHRTLSGRRLVPLGEVKGIAHCRKIIKDEDGNRIEQSLMIETMGQPIRFGRGLDERERRWLVDRLIGQLRALAPEQSIEHQPEEAAKSGVRIEVLEPDQAVPGPPSDSTLRLQAHDCDRREFVRKGTLSPTGLGIVTALALFWNCGVGTFAIRLVERFTPGDFLILLPFGAIGLVLFAVWVLVLLAPFMVQRWVIGPREASTRFSCLGLGRTRRFDVTKIVRVELRWDSPGPGKEDDTPYSLRFVRGDGREPIAFCGFTEGEARWVGGVACDVLKGSLPEERGRSQSHRGGDASLWDHELDG